MALLCEIGFARVILLLGSLLLCAEDFVQPLDAAERWRATSRQAGALAALKRRLPRGARHGVLELDRGPDG